MGSLTASSLSCLAAFHLLFVWLSCQGAHAESEADQITCFYYDGAPAENNTICPGSNACCGYQATCLSNRLCHNPTDIDGLYVRGPCAIDGWDSSCAQICLYDETTGVFPRATQCDDGSWCCNNNAECCDQGAGVFLDATGGIATAEAAYTISYPPASGTSTGRLTVGSSISTSSGSTSTSASTTSATTTSSSSSSSSSSVAGATTSAGTASITSQASDTTATPSSSSSSSSSASSSDNSSSSTGMQVGLGVGLGVPLVAIISGGLVWMLLRRKRGRLARRDQLEIPGGSSSYLPSNNSPGSPPSAHHALIAHHQFMTEKAKQNAVELNSFDPRLEGSGARTRQELPAHQGHLVEMP